MDTKQRAHFGGRFAVVMAMAGSAIGLGNIWRFPYMVGQHGGAAFILVYFFASVFLSLPIFLAESIIGRRAHAGTFSAFSKLAPGTAWKWLSLIPVFSPVLILSYYSVVGGWSADYLLRAAQGVFATTSPEVVKTLFGSFISSPWRPLVFHTVFIGMTALIVLGGVNKGIERFSKISIPTLFVLVLVIMGYSMSLPGARAGIDYLIRPDFSKLDADALAAAMGQSFFSLSLGVGCILIYSSYVRKDENLVVSGFGTAFFDLLFALIAGFAIMPAVFAANIEPGAGPGLIFETLPYIFARMGVDIPALGTVIPVLFFIAILVAALSSSISLLEAGVSFLVEEVGMFRKGAIAILTVLCWILGAFCSLSFGPLHNAAGEPGIFNFCDQLVSNFLMPFGSLLFTLFVGWQLDKGAVREELLTGRGDDRRRRRMFPVLYYSIRYVAPLVILAVFLTNLFW